MLNKLLIINPNSKALYQNVSHISAIETNIWAGLLANSVRSEFDVTIEDFEAEPLLNDVDLEYRVRDINPNLILFVVTGQNPNASTAAMSGAIESANKIKELFPNIPIAFVGPHVNSLPHKVLEHTCVDIAFINEGVYALKNLLRNGCNPEGIKGIWYKSNGEIKINPPERIVPQELLEQDLPGIAYDLMPDLSHYRTSQWHTNFIGDTSPFASIYTSLGCFATCNFCLKGDTKVTFSINQNQQIKNVNIGDKLLGWDTHNQRIAETEVVNIGSRTVDELYIIKLSDGKTIKCTKEHPFYINRTWVEASQLRVNDELLVIHGNDKLSFRMRQNNPASNKEVALRGAKTRKENGYIPYLATEEGRKKISKIASIHMKQNNPMFKKQNQLKASLRMRGSNNPAWSGGTSKAFQQYPLEFSQKLKRFIRKRDNKTCQECGKNQCRLDVHHIDYDKHNNDICNLITLCMSCHMKTNHNREFWKNKYESLHKDRGYCPHLVKIESIIIETGSYQVYNLECHPYNNYFANNVLVHNCMINSINRTSNDLQLSAADFNTFRFWNPEFTIRQLEYLASCGIKHLKIADEMFVYRPKHFIALCDLIIDRGLQFNIWAYSRVDTCKPHYLEKLKAAGVNWLALGIESANQTVRQEIDKGRFKEVDIREVVKSIQDVGINVVANYIVGLGHDNWQTMQQTMNLATELNTENMNVYCATALPGSPLYLERLNSNKILPENYSEYGFLSYDHVPSDTEFLSGKDVLSFRDYFFQAYFTNPNYLNMIYNKFGPKAVDNIKEMTKIQLKRKLLGD